MIFSSSQLLMSQVSNQPTGLIMDEGTDTLYNKVPHVPKYTGEKFDDGKLEYSLKPYCPRPGNQEGMASCVGWSCGYAALTIMRAIAEENQDTDQITERAHSALYVYNQIISNPSDCNSGASLLDALNLLKEKGDCIANQFDVGLNCDAQPLAYHDSEASKFKISNYAAVFSHNDSKETKIQKTKQALLQNYPVIVGMEVDVPFLILKETDRWVPDPKAMIPDKHAMVVVGYDEVLNTFELMNSFGADWANNGFVWIGYEDFAKYCRYGLQMVYAEESDDALVSEDLIPKKIDPLKGAFEFRWIKGLELDRHGDVQYDRYGNRKLDYQTIPVSYSSSINAYRFKEPRQVGDLFHLAIFNVPKGNAIYIFSIDAKNKVNLHWPQEYQKDSNIPIDNYIPGATAELIIPQGGNALRLSNEGNDHLVVLFSHQEIKDMEDRIEKIRLKDPTLPVFQRVESVFADILTVQRPIFDQNRMSFELKKNHPSDKASYLILQATATR